MCKQHLYNAHKRNLLYKEEIYLNLANFVRLLHLDSWKELKTDSKSKLSRQSHEMCVNDTADGKLR